MTHDPSFHPLHSGKHSWSLAEFFSQTKDNNYFVLFIKWIRFGVGYFYIENGLEFTFGNYTTEPHTPNAQLYLKVFKRCQMHTGMCRICHYSTIIRCPRLVQDSTCLENFGSAQTNTQSSTANTFLCPRNWNFKPVFKFSTCSWIVTREHHKIDSTERKLNLWMST